MTPSVLIANINRGQLSTATVAGIIASTRATPGTPTSPPVPPVAMTALLVESGPYLDDGRNKAVANALTIPDWEWLLFIDSDIEFGPAHITALLAPTTTDAYDPVSFPVLGGVYFNPFDDAGVEGEDDGDHVGPVVYDWTWTTQPGIDQTVESFRRISREGLAARPPASPLLPPLLTEVGCVGTGFMAIHRSLLTFMESHFGHPCAWFHEPIVNSVHLGEDMGFCHRVRSLGYPVLVNRACRVMHHKTLRLA